MNSFLVMLSLFLLSVQYSAVAGQENPLFESSNHLEMVQLAGYGHDKLSSVLVSGTVLCGACLPGEADEDRSSPIADAAVAVTCKTGGKRKKHCEAKGVSDEYGEFIIDLPSELHAHPNLDKVCTVRVTSLPKNSPCSHHHFLLRKPKVIRLASVGNSIRMYTAGTMTFKQPSKPWRVCLKRRGKANAKSSWRGFR
ncbi:hypothetical protein C5167_009576 [Papaver somniferum]|uniref:Pollen Ole e 1 allergen and extensin family protein n=1 Tax=Papaver somniferum TaxID=3469 RepID=A0A4Y7JXS7_PAPSO|nr:uncharacterized protein LOC113288166 [Papaver somniferum]RZC65884.1 hypothetical protein C5167_009576 [Papaver somniferum]